MKMDGQNLNVTVGFITYGELTLKYLPFFLPSLALQSRNLKLLYIDNTEDENPANREFISTNYPDIELVAKGENLGFARTYNLLLVRAVEAGAEYFLALNPDMILEPGAIDSMVRAMENDQSLGSASPKVRRWNFETNEKTEVVDTCGIKLLSGLRFIDVGQGSADRGQFDRAKILGPSGAAALYRISALEKVSESGRYFDELMFMYKEDCDLAYRLSIAGFKSRLVPDALIYHDRTAAGGGKSDLAVASNRKNKSRQVKRWSFLNQQIIFIKYWRLQDWHNKLSIIWYGFKMIAYALFFEQYLLQEFISLYRIKNKITIYKK